VWWKVGIAGEEDAPYYDNGRNAGEKEIWGYKHIGVAVVSISLSAAEGGGAFVAKQGLKRQSEMTEEV
jgi:hypothetical protein